MKRCFVVLIVVAGLLLPQSAFAWNYTGHEVVARIAWERMKPQTRKKVIALMLHAPADADLASLLPADNRPMAVRQRDFFVVASTWADIIKDREKPARLEKYSRSIWHYINYFWKVENGRVIDVDELKPEKINIVERLAFLKGDVLIKNKPPGDIGIDIAWVVHLIGDIHQPLHTSARVTELEPKGDQGGNLFLLTPAETPPKETKRLHAFWDEILNENIERGANEADVAYANRIAKLILRRYPAAKMKRRLKLGRYAEWANEGFTIAKTKVYPSSLLRFQTPSDQYRRRAYRIVEPAIALAGYRLAATLNSLFSKP